MIKVYLRAIVPTQDSYVLMGDKDKEGKQIWDLPGGELQPGVDFRKLLKKLVLEHTGYHITDLKFFEIASRIKPRARGVDPSTIVEFIFTSQLEDKPAEAAGKDIDLLRFEKFEWFESGGVFRDNKIMNLLSRYHGKHYTHDKRLSVDVEPSQP